MWCDIKNTKYGNKLEKQLGKRNAQEFSLAIETEKFKKWFGSGKVVKLENGVKVPFINPIMQIINERGDSYNLLERFRFQNINDVRNFFSTNQTPGIRRWQATDEDTFFISKDDNRYINLRLLDEIDRLYPGLIIKSESGRLYNTTKDYQASSIESAAAKSTWYFTLDNYYSFNPQLFYQKGLSERDPLRERAIEESKLKTLLDKLKTRFGVDYEIVDRPEESWRGRYTSTYNKVAINKSHATKDTAFHEYLHPFVIILRQENPALLDALYKELRSDKKGIEIIEKVRRNEPTYYESDILEEALVEYIGLLASEKYDKPMSPFNRFVKWLKNLLKKINIDIKNLDLNTSIADVADYIVDDIFVADLAAAQRNAEVLVKNQKKDTELTYANVFDKIKDRVAILNATIRKRKQGDQFKDDIAGLNQLLKDADEITSINNFVANSLTYVDSAYARFEKLREDVKKADTLSKDDISYNLYVLGEIQQLLNVYESLNDVRLLYVREGRKYSDDVMQELSESISKHDLMVEDFKSFATTWLTEWLYPYISPTNKILSSQGYNENLLSKDKFREQLDMAVRDISAAGYWLGATINSEDPVSAAIALALKDVVYENHVKDLQTKHKLETAYNEVKGSSLFTTKENETDFNMQFLKEVENYEQIDLDEDGNPIKGYVKRLAFHTEYNVDQFDKAKIEFYKALGKKPKRNEIVAYKEYQRKVAKFYRENTQVAANAKDIIESKKLTLSKRAFEKWILENTRELDEEYYDSGYAKSDFFSGKVYTKNEKKGTFRIYSGELIKPSDKYKNKEFDKMMKNPYYKTLYNEYKEANSKLGQFGLKYGMIPQVSKGKNLFSSIKWEKGLKENLKDLAKHPIRSLYADYDSAKTVQRQDGTEVKHIPINFTRLLEAEDVSVDLLSSVMRYSQMANNYEGLSAIEPNILILKTVLNGDFNLGIEGRNIAKTNSKGKQVINAITKKIVPKLAKDDLLNARLNDFIDDVVYGDEELKESLDILGREISLNKLGDNLGLFTSLSTMALNFNGGINNVMIGNFNNAIEAVGSRFYSKKDFLWAQKEYWANIHHSLGDIVGAEESLFSHLAEHYDVPQGEFKDQFGQDVSGGAVNKLMKTSSLFFIQKGGEHQIQVTGLLALMKATKVKTKSGSEINLYEAWEQKPDGKFGFKDNVLWTKEDDSAFRNRLHAVTKNLQGVYNKFDKAVLQRKWYGKLALMFRKYMFSSFKARYGRRYVDYELGTIQEGYWNLFVKKLWTEAKDYKFGMFQRMWSKEGYNEIEKAAFNKTVFELSVILAAMVLAGIASSGGDDDDSWLDNEVALQITRMSSDITQFINPGDFIRVVRNPAASINIIEKWLSWGKQLFNPFEEYERASGIAEKGDNKLYIKTLKALPIIRQFVNFLTPEEQIKFYQLSTK